jgi:hypothetical protein
MLRRSRLGKARLNAHAALWLAAKLWRAARPGLLRR